MARKKKEFRLFDAVLAAVCIVLVVEAAAPAAAIGPMQYLWWAIMLIAFFIPYGMISAELGTAYDDEGGLYDWVKRAFGRRNGSRVAWYYWVNFPLWMGSLAVIFTDIFTAATGIEIPWGVALLVQLLFIWFVILISNYRVSQSKWLINIGTFVKVALMVFIGVLGIYGAVTKGVATSTVDISPLMGISFVSIILFNFMGFEVVATFAGDMRNPKKEIPKAIIIGGILIAVFYLFASFGIGVAIPVNELSVDSGFMDAVALLLGSPQGIVMVVVGFMFMFTLIANLASWSFGVNYVAMYAARDHAMPKVFDKENKHEVPSSSNIINGVVASAIVVVATIIGQVNEGALDTFWTLFALNVVTLLISYVFMFPAFYKLRKTDPNRERPYRVPGKKGMVGIMTFVPLILLILAIIFSMFPYNADTDMLEPDWVLIIGVIIAVVLGEIIAAMSASKAKKLGLPNKVVDEPAPAEDKAVQNE